MKKLATALALAASLTVVAGGPVSATPVVPEPTTPVVVADRGQGGADAFICRSVRWCPRT